MLFWFIFYFLIYPKNWIFPINFFVAQNASKQKPEACCIFVEKFTTIPISAPSVIGFYLAVKIEYISQNCLVLGSALKNVEKIFLKNRFFKYSDCIEGFVCLTTYHLKTGPLNKQTQINHLKTGFVQFFMLTLVKYQSSCWQALNPQHWISTLKSKSAFSI